MESIKRLCFLSWNIQRKQLKRDYCLNELIQWAEDEISHQEDVWRMRTVNRNQAPIDVLQDIHEILEERFHETYDIDQTRMFLSCELDQLVGVNHIQRLLS